MFSLESDELAVWVVDEAGRHLERHGCVIYSGHLGAGQIVQLTLGGRQRTFRVLRVNRDGEGRAVQVVEFRTRDMDR